MITETPPRLPPESVIGMYRSMQTIRRFEETVRRMHLSGQAPGLLHLAIGQEAVSTGVISSLAASDAIASHHRGHGHCIAKGADLTLLFAELLGRRAGYGHGRSGSMHIYDREHHNLGTNAIVGGSVPLATGAALSARALGTGTIAVSFFGDGVLNQGVMFESFNMAAIWRLPVLYVCENNGYGEFTETSTVTAGADYLDRARAFGMPCARIDGMDVLAVRESAQASVARIRSGSGPEFLLFDTYRFSGHHISDQQDYKAAAERELWLRRDPIPRLREQLCGQDAAWKPRLDAVDEEVGVSVAAAASAALELPEPDARDLLRNVYSHA